MIVSGFREAGLGAMLPIGVRRVEASRASRPIAQAIAALSTAPCTRAQYKQVGAQIAAFTRTYGNAAGIGGKLKSRLRAARGRCRG